MCDINKSCEGSSCNGCPDNLENHEYLKQRGVVRPEGNPVLEAIEKELWDSGYGLAALHHAESLDRIRDAYIQSHPKELEAPGAGGEFDAVMRKHYRIMNDELLHRSGNFRDRQDVIDAARLDIENAYNADCAADKKRIAELERKLVLARLVVRPVEKDYEEQGGHLTGAECPKNKQCVSVCGRRDDEIIYDNYIEMLNDNPPMMSFDRPAEF